MPASGSGPPAGALYLFCLTRPGPWEDLGQGLTDGEPVVAIGYDDVAAIACTVDRDEFCGSGAEERSQDPAWIGPRALRHLAVIERVMSQAPVVPARFATLFSSPDALADTVAAHLETIQAALERVRDRQEWSLKAIRVRPVLPPPADLVETGATSGLSYLEQRRRQIRSGEARQGDAQRLQEDLKQRFAALAEVHRRPVSAATPEVAFELALLVPAAALSTLRSATASAQTSCSAAGLKLVLSGPWPPYSFSSLA